jgi:beta-ketoacyl-acyl-carrier-protein synthase II
VKEKMMKRRVVVTGLGAVTPIGNTVEEFWTGIRNGKVGIGEITKFDTTDYKVKLAAEVKDFSVKERIDAKSARRMAAFSQYACAAAKEAYEDSGLAIEKEDPFRAGVIIGSGIGSLEEVEKAYEKILTKGPSRCNPLMIPLMISNMAAGNVSIQLGFRGKCSNVVTACASGTHCIGDAFRAIQYGDAEMMLAGGTESCICPTGVTGFMNLTALSEASDPLRASIPFDKDRQGFVLGEGAGVVMLEELEHARARGAKIYAELAGYGATGDAYHITSPAEDGSGAAKAMTLAMEEGGICPSQVDYINAHGTSTHHNDLYETRAIRMALKEAADQVVVNSTKSMIGHLLGAAGGVEFVTCVKSIEDGYIHQTMGTKEPGEGCDLNYAIGAPVEKELNYVLTNSLGFGGHNASLLLKKFDR